MRLPPLVAAVARPRAGAPRSKLSAAGGVAPSTVDIVDSTEGLEHDTWADHPAQTQADYAFHSYQLKLMGHRCDHTQNNFWAWCQFSNSYRCCPLNGGASYQVKAAVGCADCTPA